MITPYLYSKNKVVHPKAIYCYSHPVFSFQRTDGINTVEQSSLDLLFMQRPDYGEPLAEDIPQKMNKFNRSQ